MREAQYQFNEGALSTISENRPLMGSTARECRMQALVGNGSPATFHWGRSPVSYTVKCPLWGHFRGAEHENNGDAERTGAL